MNKRFQIIIIATVQLIFLSGALPAQNLRPVPVTDGPYLFLENGILKARWVKNDRVKEQVLTAENFSLANKDLKLKCSFDDLNSVQTENPDFDQKFSGIDSFAVITDIHGEYKKFSRLLVANGITDKNLNWTYGRGHLVILGDVFDRGGQVTDILWAIFALEKQAAASGGMVHLLLGNHEFMEFNGDETFVSDKYRRLEEIIGMRYSDLYSEKSILGNWLRSKPVVITINDNAFTHGGLSYELPDMGLGIKKINEIYYKLLNGKVIPESDKINYDFLLNSSESPLWYRGYFNDVTFNESRLDSILNYYDVKRIVVGHTTFSKMVALFGSGIIGADAGLMAGYPGEMLIFNKGVFYKGLKTGRKFWFTEPFR